VGGLNRAPLTFHDLLMLCRLNIHEVLFTQICVIRSHVSTVTAKCLGLREMHLDLIGIESFINKT